MADVEPAARRYRVLEPYLDERQRRLMLAAEATELGRGGVTALALATGVARTTIQAGMRELAGEEATVELPRGRARRPGGGRKKATVSDRGLAAAIEALAEPDAKGDPESPLRWTLKSTRQIADALSASGHRDSSRTVAHVMAEELHYSLQANRKSVEGRQHPDRDAQFRYLNEQIRRHHRRGEPVVSVDTKKKVRHEVARSERARRSEVRPMPVVAPGPCSTDLAPPSTCVAVKRGAKLGGKPKDSCSIQGLRARGRPECDTRSHTVSGYTDRRTNRW